MPTKHLFCAHLVWAKPPDGAGTHRVEFENRPALDDFCNPHNEVSRERAALGALVRLATG